MSACKVINSRARQQGKTHKKGFWAGREGRDALLMINMLVLPPSAGLSASHSVHRSFFTRSGFDASKRNTSRFKVQQGRWRLEFLKRGTHSKTSDTLLHLDSYWSVVQNGIRTNSVRLRALAWSGHRWLFLFLTLLLCPLRPLWGSSAVLHPTSCQ